MCNISVFCTVHLLLYEAIFPPESIKVLVQTTEMVGWLIQDSGCKQTWGFTTENGRVRYRGSQKDETWEKGKNHGSHGSDPHESELQSTVSIMQQLSLSHRTTSWSHYLSCVTFASILSWGLEVNGRWGNYGEFCPKELPILYSMKFYHEDAKVQGLEIWSSG